jgi:hypothetical protein
MEWANPEATNGLVSDGDLFYHSRPNYPEDHFPAENGLFPGCVLF